jgi:hypothetical protein
MQDPLVLLTIAQYKQQEDIRRAEDWRRARAARRTTARARSTGVARIARVLGRIRVPRPAHVKPAAAR